MSTTRKVLTIIFSILIVAAFAFVLTWGIINWSKVKEGMAGNGLYTQDDVQNAYEDGYNTALTDKEEYDKLINGYRDTITTQNDLISQHTSEVNTLNNNIKDCQGQIATLNEQKSSLQTQIDTLHTIRASNEATITELNGQIADLSNQVLVLNANKYENEQQINALTEQITNLQTLNTQLQETNALNTKTIDGLNAQIASLNNQIAELTLQTQNNSSVVNALNVKIAELQKSVSYYEQYISTLESGEQVVATFEFDGSVYNIQVVNKNSVLTVTPPTSTAYVIFNGWTVDGEPIDLATFRITQNTKIVADVTHKYEVNFMVDGENHNNQIVLKDAKVTIPTNPTKNGYMFEGWTLDGNNVVNLTTYTVTQNVTFTAKFTKLYSVIFKYEDTTLKTDTIKSGQYATAPAVTDTAYKVFKGWKVNGVMRDVSEYRITADTVFVADITYFYDVKFMADGNVHNTQIVEKNANPTVPNNPTKANYNFIGWSVDGTNTVDVSKYMIVENTTFTALFRIKTYSVRFMDGIQTFSTQTVEHGSLVKDPGTPAKDYYIFAGWAVSGTSTIVDLSTYKITTNTIFNAKYKAVDGPYETNAGLYKTGTNEISMTWQELIDDGYISVDSNGILSYGSNGQTLYGDLVISESVRIIDREAFSYQLGLTGVVIPSSVTEIRDEAFYNCTSMTSVVIGENVTSIGNDCFYYCLDLTGVIMKGEAPTIYKGIFDDIKDQLTIYVTEDAYTSFCINMDWYVYTGIMVTRAAL